MLGTVDTPAGSVVLSSYLIDRGVCEMGATTLKLPGNLKKRIKALVSGTDQSAHAFMVQAIARETERAELQRRFGEEAGRAEEEAFASGKAYHADEVFSYLKARTSRLAPLAGRRDVLRRRYGAAQADRASAQRPGTDL
jgi:predicted transcriptional regulator